MPRWLKILLIVLLLVLMAALGVLGGYLFRGCQERKETAAVKIVSVPTGAKILLDGKDGKRQTPATIKDLKPGKHAVKLTKPGFVDWKTTVTLEAGKTTSVDAVLVQATAEEKEKPAETQPTADTMPPPTPTQLAPADGTRIPVTPGIHATLEWSAVNDPSGVNYSVEIEYFENPNWYAWKTITGSSTSYDFVPPRNLVRWRVWVTDGAGNQSEKTGWWQIFVFAD